MKTKLIPFFLFALLLTGAFSAFGAVSIVGPTQVMEDDESYYTTQQTNEHSLCFTNNLRWEVYNSSNTLIAYKNASTNLSYTFPDAGTYTVKLLGKGNGYCYFTRSITVTVTPCQGSGYFGTRLSPIYHTVSSYQHFDNIITGDFNNDTKKDIFFHVRNIGNNATFLSNGTTFTEKYNPILTSAVNGYSDFVLKGKFNNDAYDDIFFGWKSSGANNIQLSNGAGGFTQLTTPVNSSSINGSPDIMMAGDFDNKNGTDLFCFWKASGINRVLLNTGTGIANGPGTMFTSYSPIDPISVNNNPDNILVDDFNGDNSADLFFHWKSSGLNRMFLSNSDGTFTISPTSIDVLTVNENPDNVCAGNFNGDNKKDLFFSFYTSGKNSMHFSNGTSFGTLNNAIPYAAINGNCSSNLKGDFNADGITDLFYYWKELGANRIFTFKSSGEEFVCELPLNNCFIQSSGSTPTVICEDFTGDGRTDLLFYYQGFNTSELHYPLRSLDCELGYRKAQATEVEETLSVNAYPNPFTNEVTFEFPSRVSGTCTITLYNAVGEKISETETETGGQGKTLQQISKLEDLPSGIYHYQISVDGSKIAGGKLVK